jgi:hypothetical protein
MGLEEITWNGLYATKPHKQCFAKKHIQEHFTRRRLSCCGVVKAVVRYSMIFAFVMVALTIFCKPTGWHEESGATKADGHITVDFYRQDNNHATTHHVYPVDDAYLYHCYKY